MSGKSSRYEYRRPLRTREAAAWLGICEKQLRELAKAGLVGKKVGNVWFFSQESLAELAGVPLEKSDPSDD